jgi:hypothetical protein
MTASVLLIGGRERLVCRCGFGYLTGPVADWLAAIRSGEIDVTCNACGASLSDGSRAPEVGMPQMFNLSIVGRPAGSAARVLIDNTPAVPRRVIVAGLALSDWSYE